jgi:hypothetical protein
MLRNILTTQEAYPGAIVVALTIFIESIAKDMPKFGSALKTRGPALEGRAADVADRLPQIKPHWKTIAYLHQIHYLLLYQVYRTQLPF